MILKIAQDHPRETLEYLQNVAEEQTIPTYFAKQLIEKIENKQQTAAQKKPEVA